MNKILSLLIVLLLSGCSTVLPVKQKFPEVPERLMQPAEILRPIPDDKENLSDLLDTVTENYGRYHILELKYRAWQDWYQLQKKLYEEK